MGKRFSVITADEAETLYDGEFKIADGGVLAIYPDDDQQDTYLSPAFWRQVGLLDTAPEVRSNTSDTRP